MSKQATYIDYKTFSTNNDETEFFLPGIRIKAFCGEERKYGTVVSSAYIPNITTIVLTETSEDLDATLSGVEVSVVSPLNMAVHTHDGSEGSGGPLASSATTFIALGDTPNNYDDGKYARSTTSGVEWAEINLDPTEEGVDTIASGTSLVQVTFNEMQSGADYPITLAIENTTDANPSQYAITIITKTVSGFSVILSSPTDSGNYKLNWRIGAIISGGGGTGVSDHGMLSGLLDDDHTQYHTDARGDARYSLLNHSHSDYALSTHYHGEYALADDLINTSGTLQYEIDNHNHNGVYLPLTGGTITDDLTINGNLTVQGTTITANTETVLIEDNLLVINATESGSGVSSGVAGIEVERGTLDNYMFYFQESDDTFRIGVSGSLQPVATREDTPISNGYAKWNSTSYRFDTVSGISELSPLTSNIQLNGKCLDYGNVLTVSGSYVGEIITVQVDDVNALYGKVLCQGADFNYDLASATASGTAPAYVIALVSGSGLNKVLIKGQVCNTGWNWNAGKVYLSTASGDMQQTVVSGTGQQIQVVGWALSADTIMFNPTYMVAGL
jgi:hypothetical protein